MKSRKGERENERTAQCRDMNLKFSHFITITENLCIGESLQNSLVDITYGKLIFQQIFFSLFICVTVACCTSSLKQS